MCWAAEVTARDGRRRLDRCHLCADTMAIGRSSPHSDGICAPGLGLIAAIAGRRKAGLRTIWVHRGTLPDQGYDVDYVATDVLQVMEILHGEA